MTGIGPVAVRQPRARDREAAVGDAGRIRFTPAILPPYLRRSKSPETLLPILYLKGTKPDRRQPNHRVARSAPRLGRRQAGS
jgi:putative transposase